MSKVSSMGVADAIDETRAAHSKSSAVIPKKRVNMICLPDSKLA